MKKILSNFNRRTFIFYSLYWLFFLLLFSTYRLILFLQINYPLRSALIESLLSNLAYLTFAIIGTHLIIEFIFPKLYLQAKYFLLSIIVVLAIIISPIVAYIIFKALVNPYIFESQMSVSLAHYISTAMKFVFCLAPLLWIKITTLLREKDLQQQKMKSDRLEAEIKLRDAELKILKGQLHPHFLFNTLNNLYSLSLDKSEKTPEVIIKISDLLRYIIYECGSEKVSLEKEIEFLQSYIDLEKLRYDNALKINFSLGGYLKDKSIAPMILHSFIENSFKHGASRDTGNPWIEINLIIKENWLNFMVINSKITCEEESKTGLGIENARRRLELIYPGRHSLEIVINRNTFSVFLEIQLE